MAVENWIDEIVKAMGPGQFHHFGGSLSAADLLVALYFIVLQFVIITALALLFSSFSSPLLSASEWQSSSASP